MVDANRITSKKIQVFLSKLSDLVESLPSQETKDKTDAELNTLINFLSEFRERMNNVPTIEEAKEISSTIERLIIFVKLADSDPFLSRSLGLSSAKIGGQSKRRAITDSERCKAKEIAEQIRGLSPQELDKKFSDKSIYKIIFLKQIASEMGIRVDSRATRASIIRMMSKKLSNIQGYEYLRSGKTEARIN